MIHRRSETTETLGAHGLWQTLRCFAVTHLLSNGFFCVAAEIEKSESVNVPDAAKRKKKKRTRATDRSTGTFDGNEADGVVITRTCAAVP